MKKFKRLATQVIALSSAMSLTFTGVAAFAPQSVSAANEPLKGTVTAGADTFSWDNALVYFLLTDRFKNGDTSNDHSYNRGLDANGNVVDISDDRATFHGGDFVGITEAIEDGYFNDLGVNAIWISAPYEQIHGYVVGDSSNSSYAHYSYHGYYVSDYTTTDANFGTEEEFRELVDTAHEHGIRVVIDVVLNHAGYASMYDMNEYGFGGLKDGWEEYYYGMKNINNSQYHDVYVDYTTDEWAKWWGPDWVRAGLPGGYVSGGSDDLTQSLTGLPDFKTESTKTVAIPEFLTNKWRSEGRYDEEVTALTDYLRSNGYAMTVTNCISYWLSTWVREYGIDGFRCDTAKHVDLESWRTLHDMCTDALREWKSDNPEMKLDDLDFWMTGEAWGHTLSYDGYYTTAKFDSMINFETSGGNGLSINSIANKYGTYASALNTNDNYNVLSYISSHDSTLARGDMIYTGSAFLLLPGGVQIYYGDETKRPYVEGVANDGNGGAGHSLRSDMNWDSMDKDVLAHWQKVGSFRSSHIAVGAGTHTTVNATSGVGFTRTYNKNGIVDRIAACIGATANSAVTIDVSNVWEDGEEVVNCYDDMTAIVANGKVTFNAGENGTILIADAVNDGMPRVFFEGDDTFTGTQQVTVSLKNADYAIVSVDGAKKFIVYDGDKITIGETAYEGDTVIVSYKAVNDESTKEGSVSFYKDFTNKDSSENQKTVSVVKVKMADGSAPYLYAWKVSNAETLNGSWPGTELTEKDSDGYYYAELKTTEPYNIIFNNGMGLQTSDIESLIGDKVFELDADYKNPVEIPVPVDKTITITVVPYSSEAPYLYVWDNNETQLNGEWPGTQLTQTDINGNYVYTIDGYEAVNCIVNIPEKGKTADIKGINCNTTITVNSDNFSSITIMDTPKIDPKLEALKQLIREVKNMTSTDYTIETWNALYAFVDDVDALAVLGEDADLETVYAIYDSVVAARSALALKTPDLLVDTLYEESTVIKGIAPCESMVTITIGDDIYNVYADEITGEWTVELTNALVFPTLIKATAERNSMVSAVASYMIEEVPEEETTQTEASTEESKPVLNGVHKAEDGNVYYYVDGNVDTTYTGMYVYDGQWIYINSGKFDTSYTGMAKNSAGVWYMKNGVLDRTYTGMYVYNGQWIYVNKGKFDTSYTGTAKNSSGVWYMKNGVLDRTFTGLVKNATGVWYMNKGKYDATYTGMALYNGQWSYVNKGKLDLTYTGMAKNSAGVWYMKNGVLDRTYTGMYIYDGQWSYVNKGKLDLTYTGMAKNSAGWWYMKNGVLDRTYTGMATNEYGVWYMNKGKLDTTYTGMVLYNAQWSYVNKGKLDLTYTGMAKNSAGVWYMKNGVLDRTYTGMYIYDGQWSYVNKGKLDLTYTGIAKNSAGWWYMNKGVLDRTYTGKVVYQGVTYSVVNGKVAK